MGRPEAAVEKYLLEKSRKQGFLCWKFETPSQDGVPDRILIGNGMVFFVETKRPGGKTRPLQDAVIRRMQDGGAIVHVIDTREKVDALLASLS